MKEVEGKITAEEALRYPYKLIFKQDLKEIRQWGLFTNREGQCRWEDTISKFFGASPFSFYRTYFWQNNKKPSQNSEGLLKLNYKYWFHHSFIDVLLKKRIKKILNKPIDLIGNLSQEITCRYHVDEDFIVSMASNKNAQFKHIFICNLNYKA